MSLKLNEVVNPDGRGVFDTIRGLFGSEPKLMGSENRRGGIVDPKGIERIITRSIPVQRIGDNIRAGHLQAVSVSATHIRSGRTTVFVQTGPNGPRYQSNDPTVVGVPATLTPDHALASAAIPFLFPAVRLDGELYSEATQAERTAGAGTASRRRSTNHREPAALAVEAGARRCQAARAGFSGAVLPARQGAQLAIARSH